MDFLTHLNKTTGAYREKILEWDFHYRSYLGGFHYKEGEYLRKYFGEDSAPFDAYGMRIESTPLDNHVKTTVDVYRSFIYKNSPKRTFGQLASDPTVNAFVSNVDMEGQGMDSFLKTALDWAVVLGNVWIGIDKPAVQVETAADEIALGIRPYTVMYTPQMVPYWKYKRHESGVSKLSELRVIEECNGDTHVIRTWTPEVVYLTTVVYDESEKKYTSIIEHEEMTNQLGYIPFVNMVPRKGSKKGVGVSIVADVADQQKFIYNMLSELEQNIRISSHPSLVKTNDTNANAGAGSIITIPENMDPGLKPYLLQPNGATVSSIIDTIKNAVDSINRMTHLSAVRATAGSSMSGVALQTERQLLNAMLCDLADTVQETEYAIWAIFFDWMNIIPTNDLRVEYSKTFDIRDAGADIDIFAKAKELVSNLELQREMDIAIAKTVISDEVILNMVIDSIENQYEILITNSQNTETLNNNADNQTV